MQCGQPARIHSQCEDSMRRRIRRRSAFWPDARIVTGEARADDVVTTRTQRLPTTMPQRSTHSPFLSAIIILITIIIVTITESTQSDRRVERRAQQDYPPSHL